jgi:phosphoenolpyruvate-protein kinase (PTS system EI component)
MPYRFMLLVQATPYVPGTARGVLAVGPEAATPGSLVIVSPDELERLATRPAGILVVDGAPLSHTMIRLLGAAIPTVIIGHAQAATLQPGMEAVLDGAAGFVGKVAEDASPSQPPPAPAESDLHTADGVAVDLRASVADSAAAARAVTRGAAAIGLVRSEYLTPAEAALPGANFYRQAFAALCREAAPLPVTVRLLDVAADKRPPWLPAAPGIGTPLGLLGSRLYREEPVRSVLLAQLDALGRLAPEYALSLLIPYITQPGEFRHWREVIEQRLTCRLPIGAMAETPAAVLALPELLDLADFVAIGCNDLLQCLFAADRDSAAVSGLIDPYAPAIFRLLRHAAQAAHGRLDRVQLCGLLPQLAGILPVLIGLGYRAFSVEPVSIPWLARTVAATRVKTAAALAEAVCAAPDADAVRRTLGLPSGATWALGSGR